MIIYLEDVIWEDLYFCGLESDIQLAMKRWKVSSCQQLQLTCVRFSDLPFFIFYSRNAWKSFKPLTLYRYFYLLFLLLLLFFFDFNLPQNHFCDSETSIEKATKASRYSLFCTRKHTNKTNKTNRNGKNRKNCKNSRSDALELIVD